MTDKQDQLVTSSSITCVEGNDNSDANIQTKLLV